MEGGINAGHRGSWRMVYVRIKAVAAVVGVVASEQRRSPCGGGEVGWRRRERWCGVQLGYDCVNGTDAERRVVGGGVWSGSTGAGVHWVAAHRAVLFSGEVLEWQPEGLHSCLCRA